MKSEIFEEFPGESRFNFPENIKRVTAGNGGESLLILGSDKTALYDCGMAYCNEGLISNIERELKEASRDGIDYVILSHTHYDHIGALPYILLRWPKAKVIASKKAKQVFEREGARKTIKRLSEAARDDYSCSKEEILLDPLRVDITIGEGDKISLGEEYFRAIETKGHTDCSLAYLLEPASILFASESTGILRGPGDMDTVFLKSYKDSIFSAEKCEKYNAKRIIVPHYGIIPRSYNKEYFRLYKEASRQQKDFVLECAAKDLDFDEIYKAYEGKYWSLRRSKAQPKAAFKENGIIAIRRILEEFKNV